MLLVYLCFGILYLVSSLIPIYFNRVNATNLSYLSFVLCLLFWMFTNYMYWEFEFYITWSRLVYVGPTLCVFSAILFTYFFPKPDFRVPSWIFVCLGALSGLVVYLAVFTEWIYSHQILLHTTSYLPPQVAFNSGNTYFGIYLLSYFLISCGFLFYKYRSMTGPDKHVVRTLLISLGITYLVSFIVGYLLHYAGIRIQTALSPLFSSIFVFTCLYCMLKHHLFDIPIRLSRSISLILTMVTFFIGGSVVAWLNAYYLSYFLGSYTTLIYVFLFATTAPLFPILRLKLQTHADKLFLKGRVDYKEALNYFNLHISHLIHPNDFLSFISHFFHNKLELSPVFCFLPFPLEVPSHITSTVDADSIQKQPDAPTSFLRWSPDQFQNDGSASQLNPEHTLPKTWFQNTDSTINGPDLFPHFSGLSSPVDLLAYPKDSDVYAFASKNGIQVCLPCCLDGRVVCLLFFGPKMSEDPFSGEDFDLFATLGLEIAKFLELIIQFDQIYSRLQFMNNNLQSLVDQRTVDLRHAKDQAEKANHIKSQFLAMMSHELRTPLHVIVGMTSTLRSQSTSLSSEAIKERARLIEDAGQLLRHLVDDILDVSRLEQGKLLMTHESFYLSSLLTKVSSVAGVLLADKPTVEFALENEVKDETLCMSSDSFRLHQVLLNLLSNAVKFTASGQIKLSVRLEDLSHQKRLCFAVSDTGVGIKSSELESVFDVFTQLDQSLSRQFEGSGLGLTISKQLVELLGGEISVSSTYGDGSCFSFWIPFVEGSPSLVQEPFEYSQEQEAQVWKLIDDKSFLMCDDQPLNLVFSEYLFEGHSSFSTVGSGMDAISFLRDSMVDVVFMDIRMPGMTGVEALKEIRKLPDGDKVIVVATTAQSMKGDAEALLEEGFDFYLAKPFSREELLSFISLVWGGG